MELKEIIFGGAMLSVLFVFITFVASLSLFLYKWFIDVKKSLKSEFYRGYQDGMVSD